MRCISDELRNQTVSIIGLAKGTGKTTVLNRLLYQLYKENTMHSPAITSAGFDGAVCENHSSAAGSRITISEGSLVATASSLFPDCDFTAEVLAATSTPSPLGEIYIFKAHSPGHAILGGPSSSGTLLALKKQMFALGAQCLLIDGAAGRRSVGTAEISDGIYLCTAPWIEMTQSDSLRTSLTAISVYTLPVYAGEESPIFLPGAVTDRSAQLLLQDRKKLASSVLVADDPSKLLLSPQMFSELKKTAGKFTVLKCPKLLGVFVNPISPTKETFDIQDFICALSEQTDAPVCNLLEEFF